MIKDLEQYSKEIYPFHMPGHKLGRLMPLATSNLYGIDVTEVEGTDNLQNPEGIIKAAQDRARRLYGSREAYFLVNGSSGGILASISACCEQDGEILLDRNCHKSVYHGVLLNRLDPIYLHPEYMEEYGLLGGISPENVRIALQENPGVSCLVITSPTYNGIVSDIERIAAIVHEHHKVLIVDEAHGAHFKLHPRFPKSALDCGADIVIHSLHKTLPAFTQSALLHVNSNRVDEKKLRAALNIYQTTSPSYILMAGMEQCISFLEKEGDGLFQEFIRSLEDFREGMGRNPFIKLLDQEIIGQYDVFDLDFSRLTFVGREGRLNGKKIEKELREDYKIQVEMSMLGSFVGISTLADTKEGFDRLLYALDRIGDKKDCIILPKFDIMKATKKVLTPFAAMQEEKMVVSIDEAKDCICGQWITLYPPGIPILIPGERVEEQRIIQLQEYLKYGFILQGLEDGRIEVIKRGMK
jgi:arginine/lysine/ornithine decarboxylase